MGALRSIVLLAGGRSSRLGTPKGLVEVGGHLWIMQQLARVAQHGAEHVVVVLGHHAQAYRDAVPALASSSSILAETNVRLDVVENAEPELGTFSSIQCGLLACPEGALVWPIDVPCPSREVWSALESACTGDVAASVPVHAGRGGHPVALSASFVTGLVALDPHAPESRLDLALRREPSVMRISTGDARVTTNLNTREDWDAWLAAHLL